MSAIYSLNIRQKFCCKDDCIKAVHQHDQKGRGWHTVFRMSLVTNLLHCFLYESSQRRQRAYDEDNGVTSMITF